MNGLTGQRATGNEGFCRHLPEVSARERDFWRQAVAEERERLVIAEHGGGHAGRRDTH